MGSNASHDLVIQQTFAFLPIGHENGQRFKERSAMPEINKMQKFMQNDIFHAGDRGFVKIA